LGPSCGRLLDEVKECHLPTGRIAFEQFIRLIILEFGVTPRRGDWETVLDDAQAAFEAYRTWP
jgi:hypothetical protein